MSTTPMTKIREWREEFSKRFGTSTGVGGLVELTYGSDTMLVSESEIKDFIGYTLHQELSSLEGEVEGIDVSGGGSGRRLKEQVLAIIRQHKEG